MIKCKTFDDDIVACKLKQMPCGGIPIFDADSGYAYRCDKCNAVIGSVGQSDDCKKINNGESND